MFRRSLASHLACTSMLFAGKAMNPATATPSSSAAELVTPNEMPKTSVADAVAETKAASLKAPSLKQAAGVGFKALQQQLQKSQMAETQKIATKAQDDPRTTFNPKQTALDITKAFEGIEMKRFLRWETCFFACTNRDLMLSLEESPGAFTFNRFITPDVEKVAKALLMFPAKIRNFHCVVGMKDYPCDWFADVDLKKELNIEPEALLERVIRAAHEELQACGLKNLQTMILTTVHADKYSYHIHIRDPKGCLKDFTAARTIAQSVNEKVSPWLMEREDLDDFGKNFQPLDTAIYRECGQLRTAFSTKVGKEHLIQTPYAPQSAYLKEVVASTQEFSPEQVLGMSFMLRPDRCEKFKIVKPKTSGAIETDRRGWKVKPHMRDCHKEDRYREAIAQIRKYPADFAQNYSTWVAIGCSLYSFGGDDRGLEAWMNYSRQCGAKYDPEAMKKYWNFHFRGGKRGKQIGDTWQRGYNYLMFTIWKGNKSLSTSKAPPTPKLIAGAKYGKKGKK